MNINLRALFCVDRIDDHRAEGRSRPGAVIGQSGEKSVAIAAGHQAAIALRLPLAIPCACWSGVKAEVGAMSDHPLSAWLNCLSPEQRIAGKP